MEYVHLGRAGREKSAPALCLVCTMNFGPRDRSKTDSLGCHICEWIIVERWGEQTTLMPQLSSISSIDCLSAETKASGCCQSVLRQLELRTHTPALSTMIQPITLFQLNSPLLT